MSVEFVQHAVRARVPATSANLGSGYDSFGLALQLFDEVTARVASDGLAVTVAGAGSDSVTLDEAHLVVRSMRAAFDRLGGQPAGLQIDCSNEIPHGRGLGSSAAAIVSGIVAARALTVGGRELLDDAAVLALASDLEGHPDNVAACLHGGLTIAWTEGGVGRAAAVTATGVYPVVFVPSESSATHAARAVLPAAVPHADAAFNVSRSALLVLALTGRPELLLAATEDRLHQGYRAAAMPASAALVGDLRAQGIAAVVSGAGSSVLALADGNTQVALSTAAVPAGWQVMELPIAGGATTTDPTLA